MVGILPVPTHTSKWEYRYLPRALQGPQLESWPFLGAPHNPGYEGKVKWYEVKLHTMEKKFQEISLSHGVTW